MGLTEHLQHRDLIGVFFWRGGVRKRCVAQEDIARSIAVVVGAEPEVGVLLLGRGVDETPLITTEGQLFVIVGHNILAKFGPDLLDQISEVTNYREVPQDGVATLHHVMNRHTNDENNDYDDNPQPPRHVIDRRLSPMLDLLPIAERVVEQAARGEQVEAFVSQGSSTEVKAYGGEIESFTAASSAGIGIRVISDGRVGFAHAGTLDEDVIAETLAEARDNRAFAEPDEWVALSEPDGGVPIVHDHWDDAVATTPTEWKVQLALDLEQRTLALDPRIKGVRTASYADSSGEMALATSTGVRATDRGTGAHVSVAAMARDGDETQIAGGYDVDFGPTNLSIDKAAADAVHRATRLLGAQQPMSQRVTIVLEPRMAATIVGITVGMLNGERTLKGRTPFLDRIGESIASPLLSVFDDPTDSRSFGATSVDSEGQTCRPLPLIDEGVLGGFLHNTYTGRRSGQGTTANGIRGYRSTPGVGAHVVIISPGTGTLEEIIGDVDLGVLVTSMSGLHSGVNAISGDFSVGLDGLMIRNGVLSEPIREATIASTIQKMLTDIVAVGADTEWQPGGSGPVSLAIADVSMSGA
jgi:PmbA protein